MKKNKDTHTLKLFTSKNYISKHRNMPKLSHKKERRTYDAKKECWLVVDDYKPISFLTAIIVFVVYCMTVNPSIVGGDNGEVLTGAIQLGTVHPPGYPLITMVGHCFWKLFQWTGKPALVLNILSIIFASIGAFFTCASVFYLTNGDKAASLFSTLLTSFGETLWTQSVQYEVFPMNNMFIAIVIFLTVRFFYAYWQECKSELFKIAMIGAFTAGLSMCNQQTILFYLIPIILTIFVTLIKTSELSLKRFGYLAIAFILGLTPYFYLMIASFFPKLGNWGDMRTFKGLISHILRSEYGTFRLFSGDDHTQPGEMLFTNIWSFIQGLLKNTLGIGTFIGLVGMYICFMPRNLSQRKEEKVIYDVRLISRLLLVCFLCYVIIFHYLANLPISDEPLYVSVQMRFWMQGIVLFTVFIGMGYHIIFQKFSTLSCFSIPCLLLLLLLLQVSYTLPKVLPFTVYNNHLEHYGRAELGSLPSQSIFIAHGDCPQNAALYLKQCLHEYEDIDVLYLPYASYMWYNLTQLPLYHNITWPGTVYHQYGSILRGEGGNAFNLSEFFAVNLPKRRIFITDWYADKDAPIDKYTLWPHGLISEVKEKNTIPTRKWLEEEVYALTLFDMDEDYAVGTWEHKFYNKMIESRRRYVEFLIIHVDSIILNDIEKRYYLRIAEQYTLDLLHMNPNQVENRNYLYYILGVIHQKYSDLQPMISNVQQLDICIMVDALQKYVKEEIKETKSTKQANKLIEFYNTKCMEFWKDEPDLRIDFDNLPAMIPDYSNYEQYLVHGFCVCYKQK